MYTTLVVGFGNGYVENPLRFLICDPILGVGDLQRSTVLLDDLHQIDAVEV